jgi:iron complex outermembrane receptor protein
LGYSLTLFHADYSHLESTNLNGRVYTVGNSNQAHVNGLEAWGNCSIASGWDLEAGALLQAAAYRGPSATSLGDDPHTQLTLRSKQTLGEGKSFDVALRHVSQLPSPVVPAYTAMDADLGWRLASGADVMLSGRNLWGPAHREFASSAQKAAAQQTLYRRQVALTLKVGF